jgi:hypothetical protein
MKPSDFPRWGRKTPKHLSTEVGGSGSVREIKLSKVGLSQEVQIRGNTSIKIINGKEMCFLSGQRGYFGLARVQTPAHAQQIKLIKNVGDAAEMAGVRVTRLAEDRFRVELIIPGSVPGPAPVSIPAKSSEFAEAAPEPVASSGVAALIQENIDLMLKQKTFMDRLADKSVTGTTLSFDPVTEKITNCLAEETFGNVTFRLKRDGNLIFIGMIEAEAVVANNPRLSALLLGVAGGLNATLVRYAIMTEHQSWHSRGFKDGSPQRVAAVNNIIAKYEKTQKGLKITQRSTDEKF